MIGIVHYSPPVSEPWQGRQDSPTDACFFQQIQLHDLNHSISSAIEPSFAFLGFACDEGIKRNLGREGAKEGPAILRKALATLPIPTTKKQYQYYDVGNIICTNGDLETAQQTLGEAVALLLQKKITPIVFGGGHELAFGHYQGIVKISEQRLGIINMDAHFDMRPLLSHHQGSSGTPFLQIAEAQKAKHHLFDYNCIGIQPGSNLACLFETADIYQTHILYAEDLQFTFSEKNMLFIDRLIQENEILYLSLCLDVFAAAYAPGVSAPQALGLTPWQLIPYIRLLAASGKMLSYDIAELSPQYDIDHRTAKLAAQLIYDIIYHHKSIYL